jgi:hypothetical protein
MREIKPFGPHEDKASLEEMTARWQNAWETIDSARESERRLRERVEKALSHTHKHTGRVREWAEIGPLMLQALTGDTPGQEGESNGCH